MIATETETRLKVGANIIRTTAGFAGIVGTMKCAAAVMAAHRTCLRRQFSINLK